MRVRRRDFMHLLGAQGLGLSSLTLLPGCPDGDGGGGGGSTGGSGGTTTGGSTGGSSAASSGAALDSSGDGSSSGTETEGSTGAEIECDLDWWLCENFAPVDEAEAFDLPIEGRLPAALEGTYVRNGANPSQGTSTHWFTGDGMVHGVALSGGQAQWYRARYVQTAVLGVPPRDINPLDPTQHQANTSVVWHGGRLLALAEVGLPYELSPADLSTIGVHDYRGQLAGPMTAHPKIDPLTGELVMFGYQLLDPRVDVHFVDPTGALVRTEAVPLPEPVMMHDFQLTQSYVVLLDMPIVFDLDLAIGGAALPFAWRPENGARVGVMPRDGTAADVVWIDIDVGFVFHTFNAYEAPSGEIVLDAVWYPQMWVEGPSDFAIDGVVRRYRIDPTAGTAQEEILQEVRGEFPRIDPRRQGSAYRYGYGIAPSRPGAPVGTPSTTILKYDQVRGTTQAVPMRDGTALDELLFVPDGPAAAEDEGWLLGYGYDARTDSSTLLVFDATDLGAGPIARIGLPQRVPHGFHGTWIAAV